MTLDPPKEDSEECAYLVREESLPAGIRSPGDQPHEKEALRPGVRLYRVDEDEEAPHSCHSVAKYHENLLDQAGFGLFHLLVLSMAGLGLTADAVELFSVGYILPSAEHELCLKENHKGWIGCISLLGMLLGSLLWGVMGDRLGRRRTLLTALTTNGIFGVIAAFMPTYSLFMLTRFCSSVGIGGSLPLVFTYYSEFLVRKNRGRHLSFLLAFWAVGGLFVAVLAWGIIPKSGAVIMETKRLQFARWRKFLLVCALPAIVSAIGVTFLPESPRFLLEMGRHNEAMYIYKQIFAWNNSVKNGEEYQLAEMEIPGKRPTVHVTIPANRGILREMLRSLEMCWINISGAFTSPLTFLTLFLLVVWSTASFGFYGISTWLHEFTKVLEDIDYESRTLKQSDLVIDTQNFSSSTIENTQFTNLSFINVRFVQSLINHCSFFNCSFVHCSFSNVRTSRTLFRNCEFQQTEFLDTDIYDYKFQSCSHNDSFFFNTKGGCNIDFDVNFKLDELFYENLFAQLAILPGSLISSFILDRIGRIKTLGASLLLSGVSVIYLWFANSKHQIFVFEAIFSFFSAFGWTALDVISTEAYPASIRTTSFGLLSAASRLSAVLGGITFGSAVQVTKLVPVLVSSAVLLTGAVCVARLPETKDYLV